MRVNFQRLFGAMIATALLFGCDGDPSPHSKAESCLPGARRTDDAGVTKTRAANVYFDVSGSMINYGRPGRGDGFQVTPFRNLVSDLVGQALSPTPPRFFGFASGVGAVTPAQIQAMGRGVQVRCTACGITETHLDILLARVAKEPKSTTSVIVTDLWFKNNEILDNGLISLREPIRSIMASGRAIGILGFKAPYLGPVYDMPDSRAPYEGRVRYRPLFVLIVGDPANVVATYQKIERSVFFADQDLEHHFSLYSRTILRGAAAPLDIVPAAKPDVIEQSTVLASIGVGRHVPQFVLHQAAAERAQASAMGGANRSGVAIAGLRAPIDLADSVFPGAQWRGATTVDAQMWVLGDADAAARCDKEGWIRRTNAGGHIFSIGRDAEGNPILEMEASSPDLYAVATGDIALLRYSIKLTRLGTMDPAAEWFDPWSFSDGDTARLRAAQPVMFPTLNLRNLRLLIADAAADSSANTELANGVVVLKIE